MSNKDNLKGNTGEGFADTTDHVEKSSSKCPSESSKETASDHHESGSSSDQVKFDKDESIMLLECRKKALEKKMDHYNGWANDHIKQVIAKIAEDRRELKKLKEERDDAEHSVFLRQALENGANHMISETEKIVFYGSGAFQVSNLLIQQLKSDNRELKKTLKDCETQELESARKLHEAKVRLQEAPKKKQSMDSKKGSLKSELADLKSKVGGLSIQLEEMNIQREQNKVLRKLEEKEKQEILADYECLRSKIRSDDASAEEEVEKMNHVAQMKKQECKQEIENHEKMMEEMRSKSKDIKIGYQTCLWGDASASASASASGRLLPFPRKSIGGWECVMCSAEESSVVLLPCAHKNLCKKCSDVHEEQRKNKCPSCGKFIQTRILARFRPA